MPFSAFPGQDASINKLEKSVREKKSWKNSSNKKYADIFDIDDIQEEEKKRVAQDVADWELSIMHKMEV
jgi:hypothetical protein